MTREERDNAYYNFISEYGYISQIDKCIEEMSELTKALLKHKRTVGRKLPWEEQKEIVESIVDEIADVKIMCRQMELFFHVEEHVEQRIDYKIDRQIKRCKAERMLQRMSHCYNEKEELIGWKSITGATANTT